MSASRPRETGPADREPRGEPSNNAARLFGSSRWIRSLLYIFFWMILLVPLVRRWRRRDGWPLIRGTAASMGLAAIGAGWALAHGWMIAVGAGVALMALLLPPVPDPDRERKLQARHGADYLLNGGRLVSGNFASVDGLAGGKPLYLLLKKGEIVLIPQQGSGEVGATISIDEIEEVLVAGKRYLPIYVSEAKDPPVRESQVDQAEKTLTELVMKDGRRFQFEYAGAFSQHLAETAAHAIYSARRLRGADGVTGQSPEVFHVVRR